jgi:hypothetical protein
MNKMEALKYLANYELRDNWNEWGQAGMYSSMCEVILSEQEIFTQEELNILTESAEKR